MSTPDRPARDRGAVLVMALVFIVIGSLVTLPLLDYAVTVMRANRVLSDKTQRVEAVKGGLRASLADPLDLYKTCSETEDLGSVVINGMTVRNRCEFLDAAKALAETEIRYGIVTTQVGEAPPPYLAGSRYVPSDPDSSTAWLADTSLDSVTGKVMLPNLPVYGTSPRSPLGSQMPGDYVLGGHATCTVFFPGKYTDPLTLDGPTFFVNGIYYFTEPVTIRGGADVVVGDGTAEGCTTSQEAVFFAQPAPSGSHNVNGLGATWVLGDAARVVFDNTTARDGTPNARPIEFRFNQRYVAPDDLATRPSADVSIVSVNGDPAQIADLPGEGRYLDVASPDDPTRSILHVPEQFVGAVADDLATTDVNESDTVRDTGEPALDNGYLASVYTPRPRVAGAPTDVSVTARQSALIVSWTAPADDGSSPIVGYVARALTANGTVESGTCTTNGATRCVIAGLDPTLAHMVTVTARNLWTTQQSPEPAPASWVSATTVTPAGTALAAPPAPARPTVTMYRRAPAVPARTSGIAHAEFALGAAPANSTPVVGYDIEYRQVTDGDGTAVAGTWTSCNGAATAPDIDATVATIDPARLYCDFAGLDPTASYEFRVTARTATTAVSSPAPNPVHARTAAGTIVSGVPNHAALDVNDPGNTNFGRLESYIVTTWPVHVHQPPGPAPLPAASAPVAIIEFELGNTDPAAVATIDVAGYIAVPQGRFVLDNPNGFDVRVGGGIVAASMTIDDSRSTCAPPAPPGCVPEAPEIVPVGLRPIEVQRKFRIESWVAEGHERSVAVVQVNQNGAYAVNSWEVQ